MRPVKSLFGLHAPRLGNISIALTEHWGEAIAPFGRAAATRLALTAQNPVRAVFPTSGPSRHTQLA